MTLQDWFDIIQLIARLWMMAWAVTHCIVVWRDTRDIDAVVLAYSVLSSVGALYVIGRLVAPDNADGLDDLLRPYITPTTIVATFLLGIHFGNGQINSALFRMGTWMRQHLRGLSQP